jgi:hypothetical protein
MIEKILYHNTLLRDIHGFAIDENNNLYATNTGTVSTSNIVKISSGGIGDINGTISALTTSYNSTRIFQQIVYLNGFLYATGNDTNIYKVNVSNGTITTFCTLSQNGSYGIIYYDGFFYVSCRSRTVTPNNGNIYKINSTTGTFTTFISSSNFTSVGGLTIDNDINFYVSDTSAFKVLKFNSSGTLLNNSFITISNTTTQVPTYPFYYNGFIYSRPLDLNRGGS